jgi:hypothetical protein
VCEEMGGRGRRAAQRTHGLVWSAEAALLGMSCSTPWKAFEPIPPTRGPKSKHVLRICRLAEKRLNHLAHYLWL